MSEIHIRVNKRTLERTFFLLIIGAMGVFLFFSQADATPALNAQLTTLRQEVQDLQAENQQLEQQLEELQRSEQLAQEAEDERDAAIGEGSDTEDETSELSGELSIAWDVRMNGEALERVLLTMNNGLAETQELDYTLYWQTFYEDKVNQKGSVTLESGEQFSEFLISNGEGDITTNPPDTVDTLVLEIRDTDGNLIEELEKDVR